MAKKWPELVVQRSFIKGHSFRIRVQQLWSGFIQESLSQASHNGHHFNEFIATQIDVNISISGFFVNQTTTDKHLTKEKLSHTSKKKTCCVPAWNVHSNIRPVTMHVFLVCLKLCSLKQLHFFKVAYSFNFYPFLTRNILIIECFYCQYYLRQN